MPYPDSQNAALQKDHAWVPPGEATGHKWKRLCKARLSHFQKVFRDLDLWFSESHYQVEINACVVFAYSLGMNEPLLLYNDSIKRNV